MVTICFTMSLTKLPIIIKGKSENQINNKNLFDSWELLWF